MTSLFKRQLEMFVRLVVFGDKYAHLFPPDSIAGKLFSIIAASIPILTKTAGTQEASKKDGLETHGEAKKSLLNAMSTISLAADGIGRDVPEARKQFKMPRPGTSQSLLTEAEKFLQAAEPFKSQFQDHDVDLDELRTAMARFSSAVRLRTSAKGTRTKATESIQQTMKAAMGAVYRLDAFLPIKFRDDSPMLKEWEQVRRIPRSRVTKPAAQSEPETVTTTTTA